MVDEMHASLVYWISAQWNANPPNTLAQDIAKVGSFPGGSPAAALRRAMRNLSRRWQRRFDKGAEELAKYFADKSIGASDLQLQAILKKAGFAVEFKMTEAARDGYHAVIGENVGLIRSIASQHLAEVEGLVMRSVSAGRDLGTLTKDLEARYGITKRRAALIARDQNNRATAVINQIRQRSLGITEAVWMHSAAGKVPRPSHVAANGKKYDIEKGMLIDGEWILPGQKINCRCVSRSVILGFEE
jgi:SPP1 gp7 family putative phage head morphogenesis protein